MGIKAELTQNTSACPDIYSKEMLKELDKRVKTVKTALSGIDKNFEKAKNELYQDIKEYLSIKDDRKHVVLVNTISKLTTNGMECENKYTIQIDGVLEEMQKDGYEIIDIKIDASNQIMTNINLIRTLITYK